MGEPSRLDVVPAQLARVVQRCVEKDPDRRWQAASDVKLALKHPR